jgi:hypothetical protein
MLVQECVDAGRFNLAYGGESFEKEQRPTICQSLDDLARRDGIIARSSPTRADRAVGRIKKIRENSG